MPRERTPAGRVFDHASDSRVLLKLLHSIKATDGISKLSEPAFYVKLEGSDSQLQMSPSPSQSTNLGSQTDEDTAQTESVIVHQKDRDTLITI